MPFDPDRHHRRSIRLRGYDYSQAGAYFVTICTQGRQCCFGDIVDGEMHLNDAGRMVWAEWHALPARFPGIALDEFVVMPNHLHGIMWIAGATTRADVVGAPLVGAQSVDQPDGATTDGATTDGATTRVAPTGTDVVGAPLVGAQSVDQPDGATTNGATTRVAPTLGEVVGAYKSIATGSYIQGVKDNNWSPFEGRLWQRNYYEQIIRDDKALDGIRQYILDNPARWADDEENPEKERR